MWDGDPSAYEMTLWSTSFKEGDTVAVQPGTGLVYNSENGLGTGDIQVGTYHYVLNVIVGGGLDPDKKIIKVDLFPDEVNEVVDEEEVEGYVEYLTASWTDAFEIGDRVNLHAKSGLAYRANGVVPALGDQLIGYCSQIPPQGGLVRVHSGFKAITAVKEELKIDLIGDDVIDLTSNESALLSDILVYIRINRDDTPELVGIRRNVLQGLIDKLVD